MANIRKIRWYERFFDSDVRTARKRSKEMLNGEHQMVTVDYTLGGIAITMPAELQAFWDDMPYEARQEFLNGIDTQVREEGETSAKGVWDARVNGDDRG